MAMFDLGAPDGITLVGNDAPYFAEKCNEHISESPEAYANRREETTQKTAAGTGRAAISGAADKPIHLCPKDGGNFPTAPWVNKGSIIDDYGSLEASRGGTF